MNTSAYDLFMQAYALADKDNIAKHGGAYKYKIPGSQEDLLVHKPGIWPEITPAVAPFQDSKPDPTLATLSQIHWWVLPLVYLPLVPLTTSNLPIL